MKHAIVFDVVICTLLLTAGVFGLDSSKLGLQLTASVDSLGAINCKVSVKNLTTSVVTLSIPNHEPLFMVSIIDEHGQNLNEDPNSGIKRGKSLKPPSSRQPVILTLQPGEVRELEGTVTLHSSDGAAVRLHPGKYIVQARLVDVGYSEGKYKTTLFQSNDSPIVVQ